MPLYGGKVVRISDKPDIVLCDKCFRKIEQAIQKTLYNCHVEAVKENIATAINEEA